MDSAPKKTLPAKRSFVSKHTLHAHRVHDSPAYDASEEDNDPLTDDPSAAPTSASPSLHIPVPRAAPRSQRRHALATVLDDSDAGIDSPTYDGDIESSTTAGPDHDTPHRYPSSLASSIPSPAATPAPANQATPPAQPQSSGAVQSIDPEAFNPAALTSDDIQAFVRSVIAGTDPAAPVRTYKINPPPTDRPVRIYADGVYDIFHFGHALQLRQAKFSFPTSPSSSTSAQSEPSSGVHLLVGVNSDEQCAEHKNSPVMTHTERIEAVRHCRWVDEIIPDAPWVIDEAFIQKHKIDYVAHDEDPYASAGSDDVYSYAKSQGKFLPTRRTPGISTSGLLARIVARYRSRGLDAKLERFGCGDLAAGRWSAEQLAADSDAQS
ncbi:hypothetical protein OBBRIDRAFT_792395 [Obba rivulosa]|uniref:choline-phosphate cytidylyltransferase n=1 Tax=Obba rivulosa TaxID=1052685 RepID=A0A8E2DLT0_9APHY|nr:hypothetical protein OBBRIDRAFT_792395 [Obba rivulosa]